MKLEPDNNGNRFFRLLQKTCGMCLWVWILWKEVARRRRGESPALRVKKKRDRGWKWKKRLWTLGCRAAGCWVLRSEKGRNVLLCATRGLVQIWQVSLNIHTGGGVTGPARGRLWSFGCSSGVWKHLYTRETEEDKHKLLLTSVTKHWTWPTDCCHQEDKDTFSQRGFWTTHQLFQQSKMQLMDTHQNTTCSPTGYICVFAFILCRETGFTRSPCSPVFTPLGCLSSWDIAEFALALWRAGTRS